MVSPSHGRKRGDRSLATPPKRGRWSRFASGMMQTSLDPRSVNHVSGSIPYVAGISQGKLVRRGRYAASGMFVDLRCAALSFGRSERNPLKRTEEAIDPIWTLSIEPRRTASRAMGDTLSAQERRALSDGLATVLRYPGCTSTERFLIRQGEQSATVDQS